MIGEQTTLLNTASEFDVVVSVPNNATALGPLLAESIVTELEESVEEEVSRMNPPTTATDAPVIKVSKAEAAVVAVSKFVVSISDCGTFPSTATTSTSLELVKSKAVKEVPVTVPELVVAA